MSTVLCKCNKLQTRRRAKRKFCTTECGGRLHINKEDISFPITQRQTDTGDISDNQNVDNQISTEINYHYENIENQVSGAHEQIRQPIYEVVGNSPTETSEGIADTQKA